MEWKVHHADALEWLQQNDLTGRSVITSLPDISEFPKLSIDEWKTWFVQTAGLVMSKCDANGIAIFYQSDIKWDGVWIDKSYLCQRAAEKTGMQLVAHKIICRAPVGTDTHTKVGYSHLLCFSKKPLDMHKSFADVLPDAGETTWTRGMGIEVCKLACEMVRTYTKSQGIVDPFCGHGSVLAVANEMGLNAIGIDHKLKCVEIARALTTSGQK